MSKAPHLHCQAMQTLMSMMTPIRPARCTALSKQRPTKQHQSARIVKDAHMYIPTALAHAAKAWRTQRATCKDTQVHAAPGAAHSRS